MSCVIALRDGESILMASDSMVTLGDIKYTNTKGKIIRPFIDENLLIGICGGSRDNTILSAASEDFKRCMDEINNDVSYDNMVNHMIPMIYDKLNSNKRAYVSKENDTIIKCQYVVAHKNNAYKVFGDGSCDQIGDFLAIGCGMELAMGAYSAIKDYNLIPLYKVIKTMIAVCDNSSGCDYPINIMTTKDNSILQLTKAEALQLVNTVKITNIVDQLFGSDGLE